MRIKLTLTSSVNSEIPINYQYQLSSAVYRILSAGSLEYSKFLHDRGYLGPDGKVRKLFTFSRLYFRSKINISGHRLTVTQGSNAILFISSPMIEDFIQNFVVGLFENQKIEISYRDQKTSFFIKQVEVLPEPEFKKSCKFIAMSPIVLTTQIDTPEGLKTYYYRPLDKELPQAVRRSLVKKYVAVYHRQPQDPEINFKINREYIKKKGGPERVSKLITIREGFPDETRIKGFVSPFTLSGSCELMKIAWDCGLGDKCSMGFGCVGLVKDEDLGGF